ncbi:MAG: hypothetical protein IJ091_00160, partial [Oscillospiraceae bacterium]|nr:hypothetical protein [Oscillospiraceae bacterium]
VVHLVIQYKAGILCLVLIAAVVATVSTVVLKQLISEDTIEELLSHVYTGEEVLGFEIKPEENDVPFGEALRETLSLHNVSAIGVYSDNARLGMGNGI